MIGNNIKKIRESKGINAIKLAELTGYTPSYISMLESKRKATRMLI